MSVPSAEEFLDDFFSVEIPIEHVYDPVKAHEYYLRTRELKGRTKGSEVDTVKRFASVQISTEIVAARKAAALKHRKAQEAKVVQLKSRLEKPKKILKKLVEEAKKRGGDSKLSTSPAPTSSKIKADKPLTAKEKVDATRKAEEYRDKNKDQTPDQETKVIQEQIDVALKRIAKMRKYIVDSKKKKSSVRKKS